MTEQQQPVFVIEKIYVKDLSLEIPNAPHIFLDREAPEVNLQLATKDAVIDGDIHEVVLTATVTARLKEKDKVMFLVEVHQAGIFRIRNVPGDDIEPVLGILCPNILFPYLRETVSDVVTRAGFPAVILNPVNFEAVYQQKKQQQQADSPAASPDSADSGTKH
ncbi:protein-export chaperone SecB [Nitrosomonas sp. ANs5]|uniref:protein-export chaperone SecB n=1 Tax=Nitrosomonas sp. ANs5 TaxID=3423941 RepID=UPI003D32A5A4